MKQTIHAFSLLELIIVIAIINILISIGYPIYYKHLLTTNRTYAKVMLVILATKLEQYYIEHNTYRGFIPSMRSDSYKLAIKSATDHSYTIVAKPTGKQALRDAACGDLILDSTGAKYISGLGNFKKCWS